MNSPFRVNHMPGGTLRVLRDHRTVAFVKPRQSKAGELDEIADLLVGELREATGSPNPLPNPDNQMPGGRVK